MKNIDVIEPFQATITITITDTDTDTDTGFGPLTTLVAEACVSAKESICSDGYPPRRKRSIIFGHRLCRVTHDLFP